MQSRIANLPTTPSRFSTNLQNIQNFVVRMDCQFGGCFRAEGDSLTKICSNLVKANTNRDKIFYVTRLSGLIANSPDMLYEMVGKEGLFHALVDMLDNYSVMCPTNGRRSTVCWLFLLSTSCPVALSKIPDMPRLIVDVFNKATKMLEYFAGNLDRYNDSLIQDIYNILLYLTINPATEDTVMSKMADMPKIPQALLNVTESLMKNRETFASEGKVLLWFNLLNNPIVRNQITVSDDLSTKFNALFVDTLRTAVHDDEFRFAETCFKVLCCVVKRSDDNRRYIADEIKLLPRLLEISKLRQDITINYRVALILSYFVANSYIQDDNAKKHLISRIEDKISNVKALQPNNQLSVYENELNVCILKEAIAALWRITRL
jgi:hypothetical protein